MAQIGRPTSEWLVDHRTGESPERRRGPRARLAGQAMAVFSAGTSAGSLTFVTLIDASWGGLGVLSPIAVEPGTAFSMVPDAGSFPRAVGMVVRCERADAGFRLGLATTARRAG